MTTLSESVRQEKDRRRARLEDGLRKVVIPSHMHTALYNYIVERRPVGDFLTAVLENNLSEACAQADVDNIQALPAYVMLLTWSAPAVCWGSKRKVKAWLEEGENQRVVEARENRPLLTKRTGWPVTSWSGYIPGKERPVLDWGRAIRVLRADRGLAQRALAERANVGASHLSLIEHGKREPSLKTLERIAEALGASPVLLARLAEKRIDQLVEGETDAHS